MIADVAQGTGDSIRDAHLVGIEQWLHSRDVGRRRGGGCGTCGI